MSFRAWFKQWIRAFYKLVSFDYKKPKSELQRRRESERRLKAMYSSSNLYRTKKKYKKRRSSMDVENERLIQGLLGFVGISLGILLLPFGLFDWGRKSAKARKASKGSRAATKASRSNKASGAATKKNAATSSQASRVSAVHTSDQAKKNSRATHIAYSEYRSPNPAREDPTVLEADESIPKSTPKNKKDRYIRKRMIIAGSRYCDKAALDALEVGSHVDLEAEPDNPYDKNAVKLLYNGQKIGYISKKDNIAFVTSLKLNRKIYGVITAIIKEEDQTKYEFEAWFDIE